MWWGWEVRVEGREKNCGVFFIKECKSSSIRTVLHFDWEIRSNTTDGDKMLLLVAALQTAALVTPPRCPTLSAVRACAIISSSAPRPARSSRPCVMLASSSAPRPGSIAEAKQVQGKRPYGEESRRYRRTVYRHEDWLRHRSETRLLRNLKGTFTSGVVRSLLTEVVAVALVALLACLYNGVLFGYADLSNVPHPGLFGAVPDVFRMQLPIGVFTLSSPALGLLLVFRTNASYARWLEARKAWGRIVSHCRNIMRQAALWLEDDDPSALDELVVCVWAFPRSLWAHLSDPAKEPRFAAELKGAMGDEAAAALLEAPHRPLRALALLSAAVDRLSIDEKRKVEMDKSVVRRTAAAAAAAITSRIARTTRGPPPQPPTRGPPCASLRRTPPLPRASRVADPAGRRMRDLRAAVRLARAPPPRASKPRLARPNRHLLLTRDACLLPHAPRRPSPAPGAGAPRVHAAHGALPLYVAAAAAARAVRRLRRLVEPPRGAARRHARRHILLRYRGAPPCRTCRPRRRPVRAAHGAAHGVTASARCGAPPRLLHAPGWAAAGCRDAVPCAKLGVVRWAAARASLQKPGPSLTCLFTCLLVLTGAGGAAGGAFLDPTARGALRGRACRRRRHGAGHAQRARAAAAAAR